jgi:hypothetical protein
LSSNYSPFPPHTPSQSFHVGAVQRCANGE